MVNMSDIHKCGFCDLVTGLLRRVMCLWNGRGSSDSCYRELGDQDTLVHERFTAQGVTVSSVTPNVSSLEYEDELPQDDDLCMEGWNTELGTTEECDESPCSSTAEKHLFTSDQGKAKIKRTFLAPWKLENIPEEMLFKEKAKSGHLRRFYSLARLEVWRSSPNGILAEALLDSSYSNKVQLLFERHLHKWDFDTQMMNLACGGRVLPILCMHLFKHYKLIERFDLDEEKCANLFEIINDAYRTKNVYHNAVHAADVTQAVHCFLQQSIFQKYFDSMDIMLLLLAAVTHDLDHPGLNQNYLTKTEHALYHIYQAKKRRDSYCKRKKANKLKEFVARLRETSNIIRHGEPPIDQSPLTKRLRKHFTQKTNSSTPSILEFHHWRVAYSAILESGVFSHMTELLPHMKNTLGQLILATDITRQPVILNAFKRHVRRNTLNLKRRQHRLMVLQIALKTADISNPGRSWAISKKWSMKVCDEFFFQGDLERHSKVEISQLCDRNKESVPEIQIGFFKHIVSPLFKEWNAFCSDNLSEQMLDNFQLNTYKWELEYFRSSRRTSSKWKSEALREARISAEMAVPSTSTQQVVIEPRKYLKHEAPTTSEPLTRKKRQAPRPPSERSSSYERPPSSDHDNIITDADMVENDLVTYTTNTSSEMSITFDSPPPSRRASLSPDLQSGSSSEANRRYSTPQHAYQVRVRSREKKDSIPECLAYEEGFASEDCGSGMSDNAPITNSDVSIYSSEGVQRQNSLSSEEHLVQVDELSPKRLISFSVQQDCDDDPDEIQADDNTGSTDDSSSSQKATNSQKHELLISASSHSSESRIYQPLKDEMPREIMKSDGERIFMEMFPRVLKQVLGRRRGSAPSASEVGAIASNLALHANLGDSLKTRQQWVTQAEASGSQRRRSSLPAEVITGRACVTA